jgi:ComF family protein
MLSSLADLLFPKYSLRGREGEWVTPAELEQLQTCPCHLSERELQRRGITALDHVFAVARYGDSSLLRRALHTFKFRRVAGLGEILRTFFAETILEHCPFRQNACLCPVPLHWTRKFSRGFNQAEILAQGLAERSGLPVQALLSRSRPTGSQSLRHGHERRIALQRAFRLRREFSFPSLTFLPFCVYLIDDLFTSGATMEECAKVLKKAGVSRVEGLVLAIS